MLASTADLILVCIAITFYSVEEPLCKTWRKSIRIFTKLLSPSYILSFPLKKTCSSNTTRGKRRMEGWYLTELEEILAELKKEKKTCDLKMCSLFVL
jgi:hypothetical protein